VEWIWNGKIPAGALSVLAGDPGVGKSLLTIELSAQLTRGELTGIPERVLLVTAEDPIAYVVHPRLQAAGADLELVGFPRFEQEGFETSLVLPDGVPPLRQAIEQVGAKLVVIDPLMAHLKGSIDSWKDQSIRQALAPLHRMAEETGAGVLVVAHLNKGQSTDPLHRLGGSIGIAAAARSVLLLGRDPKDPGGELGDRRVLAHVKSNVSALSRSFSAEIGAIDVAGIGQVSRITLGGTSPVTGSQLLGEPAPRERKLEAAMDLLQDELADGPKRQVELVALAEEQGISASTLDRARKALDIETHKGGAGYHDGWIWSIGEPESEGADEK
jgi:AAA domain